MSSGGDDIGHEIDRHAREKRARTTNAADASPAEPGGARRSPAIPSIPSFRHLSTPRAGRGLASILGQKRLTRIIITRTGTNRPSLGRAAPG